MVAQRLAIESASIVVRQPSNPGTRRDCAVWEQWARALPESAYESIRHDLEESEGWRDAERLPFTPRDTIPLPVSATLQHCDLKFAWVGLLPRAGVREEW